MFALKSWLLASVTLILTIPTTPSSQAWATPQESNASQRAMKKLSFMLGTWQGNAQLKMGPEAVSSNGIETVTAMLDGTVFLIEGKFADATAGKKVHHALAILSYDPRKQQYKMQSHLSDGRSGDYVVEILGEGQIRWTMDSVPGVEIRYTLTYAQGKWKEVGEMKRGNADWFPFFEMNLTRQK